MGALTILDRLLTVLSIIIPTLPNPLHSQTLNTPTTTITIMTTPTNNTLLPLIALCLLAQLGCATDVWVPKQCAVCKGKCPACKRQDQLQAPAGQCDCEPCDCEPLQHDRR